MEGNFQIGSWKNLWRADTKGQKVSKQRARLTVSDATARSREGREKRAPNIL